MANLHYLGRPYWGYCVSKWLTSASSVEISAVNVCPAPNHLNVSLLLNTVYIHHGVRANPFPQEKALGSLVLLKSVADTTPLYLVHPITLDLGPLENIAQHLPYTGTGYFQFLKPRSNPDLPVPLPLSVTCLRVPKLIFFWNLLNEPCEVL